MGSLKPDPAVWNLVSQESSVKYSSNQLTCVISSLLEVAAVIASYMGASSSPWDFHCSSRPHDQPNKERRLHTNRWPKQAPRPIRHTPKVSKFAIVASHGHSTSPWVPALFFSLMEIMAFLIQSRSFSMLKLWYRPSDMHAKRRRAPFQPSG